MAITKARTGYPVRGYYVTTINTGRMVQSSGSGFGLPRLGGLINAQVEGLTGGGSGLARLAAQRPNSASTEAAHRGEKEQLKQHEEWRKDVKDADKKALAEEKKLDELNKKLADEAKPGHVNTPTSEVVKDPETGGPRVIAKDKAPAEALEHPVAPKTEPKVQAPEKK